MLFSLLTWESLLPVLTTKTKSKSWVTQSRSVHWGFLGIYPSSHVLKDWISWLMHMQAPLILFCLWKHFLTKAVVASLNKTTHPETSSWQLIYFVHEFFFIPSALLNIILNFFTPCSLLAVLFIEEEIPLVIYKMLLLILFKLFPNSHSLATSLHALSHINSFTFQGKI